MKCFSAPGLTSPIGPKILVVEGALLIMGEFICYMAIFTHMYQHDNAMVLILPEENLRKRRKGNAIQLSGHIIKFTTKMVYWYTGMMAGFLTKTNYMTIQFVAWAVIYGFNGVLLYATSPKMRRYLDHCVARTIVKTARILSKNPDEFKMK